MHTMRGQWQQSQRDAVVENRTVQNHVEQDLQPTAQRMQAYVEKSNAAPGPTAAVQAGNEELATVVAQVQALQALEITSARTDAQVEAQEQAERAYHEAEAQKVMANFYNPPKPTGQVSGYFDQQ
jgi:P-type conjugative transfer protein TrbJ